MFGCRRVPRDQKRSRASHYRRARASHYRRARASHYKRVARDNAQTHRRHPPTPTRKDDVTMMMAKEPTSATFVGEEFGNCSDLAWNVADGIERLFSGKENEREPAYSSFPSAPSPTLFKHAKGARRLTPVLKTDTRGPRQTRAIASSYPMEGRPTPIHHRLGLLRRALRAEKKRPEENSGPMLRC